MVKINGSLVEICDQISELKHITDAAKQLTTSIRQKLRRILDNFQVRFEEDREFLYRCPKPRTNPRLEPKTENVTRFKANEIEEFFTKAQLISQESHKKDNQIYSDFVESISQVKHLSGLLNEMFKIGKIPDQILREPIGLERMLGSSQQTIASKLKTLKAQNEDWKRQIRDILGKMGGSGGEYFIAYFLGKNLIKVSPENWSHYLRFIDPSLDVGSEELQGAEGAISTQFNPKNSKMLSRPKTRWTKSTPSENFSPKTCAFLRNRTTSTSPPKKSKSSSSTGEKSTSRS